MLDAGLADPQTMGDARAAAASLAYHAARVVFVAEGGAALISGGHGQRLVKEALFTLVTGSRTTMKNALLEQLSNHRPAADGTGNAGATVVNTLVGGRHNRVRTGGGLDRGASKQRR
jgi:hypothetical protein